MSRKNAVAALLATSLLVVSNLLVGFPADILINRLNDSKIVDNLYLALKDDNVVDEKRSLLPTLSGKARAANFTMQTGYYVGTGASQTISGVGFQPQFVFVKADTAAGAAAFKTSSMPGANMALVTNTADLTTSQLVLNATGFTVGTDVSVNSANVRYTWMAFAGSDCSATGTFCVGQYTGNATSPRTIATGFQPSMVIVKRTTAVAAHFRTASEPANESLYLMNTVRDTTGNFIRSFAANGFIVGHSGTTGDNVNAGVYNYIAFKASAGVMAEGTYAGNATDNRNITGTGFLPDAVLVKNATNATANNTRPVLNTSNSYGDYASVLTATANAVNYVQALQSNGFQVGTNVFSNGTGDTYYWVAFGGAAAPPPGSGTFKMATGSYTGNGTSQSVASLGFSPDLVIVKDNAANYGVFRTRLMAADNTAYLANAVANFTGGITSLGSDGFSIGASTVVNTSSNTYHWQAFGGAYKPTTGSGAEDFIIGAYMGNGIDSRNIVDMPFQPNMVAAKRNGATAGAWRSSATTGDISSFFGATAEGANRVQALSSDGFQIGTSAEVNAANSLYHWFGFRNGSNFATGTYSGTGGNQNIGVGFQPDLVWAKRSTTAAGTVHRPSSLAGNSTQHFLNTANFTNGITNLISTGFSLASTTAATNASGGTYRYVAWREPPPPVPTFDIVDSNGTSVSSPGVLLPERNFTFDCTNTLGTLGTNNQRLRVTSPLGAGPQWALSIAPTDGSAALWRNGGNTEQFDFNDTSGSPPGCGDNVADGDTKAGLLSFDPSQGVNTPQGGCTDDNIEFASAGNFQEGLFDSVNLISATAGAPTGCYWDITNIGVSQYVPGGQRGNDAYTINLTVTITAF